MVKDFLKSYESLAEMVVPRSATLITKDDEFTLYTVTTFKKVSGEFVHKCREKRWVPRDYKYKEGGKEEEQREVEELGKEERKLWGEALRLGRTGYSEGAMVWIHVLALRVFVETVLRYGLPLDFVCGLVQVCYFIPCHFSRVLTQLHKTVDGEGCQTGKIKSRLGILLPRWQRPGQRQEGQSAKRRFSHVCRDTGGPRRGRLHRVCILRI